VGGIDPAGVNHIEEMTCPFSFGYNAVAGGARSVIDNGKAFPGQTVEEGAFAHVGAPDQGNNRFHELFTIKKIEEN
jgi:hypothetical protein